MNHWKLKIWYDYDQLSGRFNAHQIAPLITHYEARCIVPDAYDAHPSIPILKECVFPFIFSVYYIILPFNTPSISVFL